MLKSKKLKKLITVVLTVILVILLSAGTSILVNKKGSVQSSVTVKNGLSAYELAVKNGYNGTVKDWLNSLNGKSAYQLAVSAGYSGTENEWAQSLNTLVSSGVQSIKTACFNSAGQLVITLSDGTELNLGNAVGKNGTDGKDGIDGKDGVNGKDGSDGKNGTNGTDGVSISGAAVNENGELVLSFSDNKTVNVGKVVGATGLKGDKGDKGDRGIQGIQGEKGEKGDTGATGATGAKGDKGDKGDQGEQGIQGIQGDKGEQGDSITDISITGSIMTVKLSTGRAFTFENIKGADGKDGISPKIRINAETGLWEISEDGGENWTATTVSALGTKGEKGDRGEQGTQGVQGEKGEKGDTGATGATGAKGEKGDKGETGAQGEQGIQGVQGEKGERGEQGLQGEKGDKGDKGEQGIQGEKGNDGISPKIKINPITNEWEISTDNGLTYVSTEIKATGEKGDKGEKGDTGATGATGAKGEKGDKGDQGIQGIQGEKGEKGDKGADGVSVTGVKINENNKLVIALSEGDPIIIDKSVVGADGKNGNGISKVTLTEDFYLVFNYTDGTSSDKIGPIKGADGTNGADGLTPILTLDGESGNLSVKYGENGTITLLGNIKGIKGDTGDTGATGVKGDKGAQGEKGDTGRGIAKTEIIDGELIVTYTDNTTQNAGKVKEDDYTEYLKFARLSDGTLSVAIKEDYKRFVKKIVIPSEYYGFKVTKIAKEGFYYCDMLEEIVLPESLLYIENYAFRACKSLTKITIPKNVKEIGSSILDSSSIVEVKFEKTNGWYQYYEKYNSGGNITGSYAVDEAVMSSPEKAAEKLKEKYEYYPSKSNHSRLDGYTFKNSD